MSLLNRGTETVVIFAEEAVTDADGNTMTRPSTVGVVARAVIQPIGTPTEDQDIGYLTTSKYRLRLIGWPEPLGAQSQIDWQESDTPSTEIPGSSTALVAPLTSITSWSVDDGSPLDPAPRLIVVLVLLDHDRR